MSDRGSVDATAAASKHLEVQNVLFLCTGNSARSILAEAYLNSIPGCRYKAFSAGSHPTGAPKPDALAALQGAGISTEGLRSKSWDEFTQAGVPPMDLIVTVCDNARGEVCPIWPGQPISAHWPFEDPAAFEGDPSARRDVFATVFRQIRDRIDRFVVESSALTPG